jgi:hypothetical protein
LAKVFCSTRENNVTYCFKRIFLDITGHPDAMTTARPQWADHLPGHLPDRLADIVAGK